MSDSPGVVDFAIGLVNSVLNLPDGQVKYFEEFNLQKNCFEWQAVKTTSFEPCYGVMEIPNQIIIHATQSEG